MMTDLCGRAVGGGGFQMIRNEGMAVLSISACDRNYSRLFVYVYMMYVCIRVYIIEELFVPHEAVCPSHVLTSDHIL